MSSTWQRFKRWAAKYLGCGTTKYNFEHDEIDADKKSSSSNSSNLAKEPKTKAKSAHSNKAGAKRRNEVPVKQSIETNQTCFTGEDIDEMDEIPYIDASMIDIAKSVKEIN